MDTIKWSIDRAHSEIGFKVKHMMFTNVHGRLEEFTGTAESRGDDFDHARFSFNAMAASLSTGSEDRDNHLRGEDFFNVEEFPEISFLSTSMMKVDDNNYVMVGDLTMRGVTKPVTLSVEFNGIMNDPWGNTKSGFSASAKLNRTDWGLTWNSVLETGGVLVSEEVVLSIDVQFVKQ